MSQWYLEYRNVNTLLLLCSIIFQSTTTGGNWERVKQYFSMLFLSSAYESEFKNIAFNLIKLVPYGSGTN